MKHWIAFVILAGIYWTGATGLAQSDGINAIQAYAGTWKTQMEHFDTAYSKAGKESSTLRNDCWKSGGYYVCDQFVNGESKALIEHQDALLAALSTEERAELAGLLQKVADEQGLTPGVHPGYQRLGRAKPSDEKCS